MYLYMVAPVCIGTYCEGSTDPILCGVIYSSSLSLFLFVLYALEVGTNLSVQHNS